jgi:hypothetical protein
MCYMTYERFRWLGGDADVLASGGYGCRNPRSFFLLSTNKSLARTFLGRPTWTLLANASAPFMQHSNGNGIPRDGRTNLRRSLAELLPVADALGAGDLREAAEACLVLLDAPFRVEQKTLAPLLKLTHERAAAVFRQGARDARGPMRARLEACRVRAEAQVEQMNRLLPTLFS